MKVLVVRPRGQAGSLLEGLRGIGAEAVNVPLIEIEPLGEEPVDLAPYDWVIVTSANGAAELARRRRGAPRRLAAVGPATAAALRAYGLEPDLVPAVSSQEGLLAEIPRPTGRVLVAAAEGARPLLAAELGADVVTLYRTRALVAALPTGVDLAVITSGSSARALAALETSIPAVSIGPETTRVARAAGLTVVAEAESYDADGLVRAVASLRSEPCSSPS